MQTTQDTFPPAPEIIASQADHPPRPSKPRLTDSQRRLVAEFTRFGVVGLIGLVIDTTTVYALRAPLGLYGAGVAAYGVAASVNWLLNRIWTFRGQGSGPAHHQWARFLGANLLGFALNRGTYAILVTFVPLAAAQPVIATASGSVAGMFVNFFMAKRYVFR